MEEFDNKIGFYEDGIHLFCVALLNLPTTFLTNLKFFVGAGTKSLKCDFTFPR